jgi:Ser/Thr protein kinase RdoA (MazF antagonist)
MKFESVLDKPALMETIIKAYGFPISSLTFVPEGMVGCHFIGDCANGKRVFITLLTNNYLAALQTQRLDFTLALMHNMYEHGLFTAQPAIYPTLDGRLRVDFLGQPLIIYEYIEGGNLEKAWPYPPKVLTSLGSLTAQLHIATASVGMDVPYIEQFHLPFEELLLACLEELEQVPEDARAGEVELRDLILPRRDTLFALQRRLNKLGESARALNPPLVLVHTDMNPLNILRTPQGKLFIVDWEGVMLAPAEHDLMIFAGEGFASLLVEYLRAAGNPRLHPEIFAYYFHRRNLEDIAGFMVSILHENTTAEEDRFDLDLLNSDSLSSWPFLEKCREWAAEQIRAVAG